MNRHALDALEFDRVLDIVAGYATSEPGADAVRALLPVPEREAVAHALDHVDEMASWLIRDEAWSPPFIPDIRKPLERLAVVGSMWSEGELVGALRLLGSARAVRRSSGVGVLGLAARCRLSCAKGRSMTIVPRTRDDGAGRTGMAPR